MAWPFQLSKISFQAKKSIANIPTPLQLDHYINYAKLYLSLEEAMQLYIHVFESKNIKKIQINWQMMQLLVVNCFDVLPSFQYPYPSTLDINPF